MVFFSTIQVAARPPASAHITVFVLQVNSLMFGHLLQTTGIALIVYSNDKNVICTCFHKIKARVPLSLLWSNLFQGICYVPTF